MLDSNTIPKVALIGAGYWGRNLARNFAELGALAAIVDSNPVVAEQIGGMNGAPARDFADVLGDPDIEGAVIATRAETHYDLARQALLSGKHVYVEKPLVLNESEADQLIALAADRARVLMVGHLLRYHPLFRRMVEIIASGAYGKLRYVYSDRMSLGKIRTEENVLWSFAPHDISMVLALTQEEPVSVTVQGTAVVAPSIADWATLQMRFPSGIGCDIRASWLHYKKVQQIVAVCDLATVVFEDSEPDWARKLTIHEHAIDRIDGMPVPRRGEARAIDVERDEPLRLECRHFLDCIVGGMQPLTDGQEGRSVLRVLQRATAAMAVAA